MLLKSLKFIAMGTVLVSSLASVSAFAEEAAPAAATEPTTQGVSSDASANQPEAARTELYISDAVDADGNVTSEKTEFTKDTPKIYLLFQSNQVKPGQKIRSVWIADDSHGVAPPNYKIDESTLESGDSIQSGKVFTGKFSMSKPTSGWPVGQYHAEIFIDADMVKSIKFEVK
jgi:hypothetical protein